MSEALEPVIIKKYANRRLYNTQTSIYITLDDVREMVRDGTDFVVRDAKTGDDLTHQILTQIIYEQELSGRQSILPIGFLKRVIEMYDGSLSEMVPHYLETTMEAFISNQDKLRSSWEQSNPLTQFGEIGRQNAEMLSKTMQMFNPFDAYFNSDTGNMGSKKKKTS